MNIQKERLWYAFVTRPRHEKKVKTILDQRGIINFLPLQRTLNQWKDRKRWVETPLFSCYIFAQVAFKDRYDVLTADSVARIVGFGNKPCPVRDDEIKDLKRVVETPNHLEVHNGLLAGDHVRIRSGPLMGMEGRLVDFRSKKYFVIYITAIGKSVLVDAFGTFVEKC